MNKRCEIGQVALLFLTCLGSRLHVNVHAVCSCRCCILMATAECYFDTTCPCRCSMSMSELHARVRATCPCPYCMYMSMMHFHLHAAYSFQCCSISMSQCCTSVLYFYAPSPCCLSRFLVDHACLICFMSMLHVLSLSPCLLFMLHVH
jgi:hypothetical protein